MVRSLLTKDNWHKQILYRLCRNVILGRLACDCVFYCCIALYPRLSGESPFQGNSDAETLALVTAARYEFDQESFEDISDQAKEFISSLLKKDRRLAWFSFLPPSFFFFFLMIIVHSKKNLTMLPEWWVHSHWARQLLWLEYRFLM